MLDSSKKYKLSDLKETVILTESNPTLRGCGRNSNSWISSVGQYRLHPTDMNCLIFVWSCVLSDDKKIYEFTYSRLVEDIEEKESKN